MKCIGVLGGMSWESTATYYRLINEGVKARLGGLHSARLLLASVDFAQVEALQHRGDWDAAGALLAAEARNLRAGGAECLLLATNTMHKVWPAITAGLAMPGLHIADCTGTAIRAAGLDHVALLGTRYTMEQDFYRGRLAQGFGLRVSVPEALGRAEVHRVIYEELCQGQVRPDARRYFQSEVAKLVAAGAQGVILGCTEIGLLLAADDLPCPVFDTTALHAAAAVDFALA